MTFPILPKGSADTLQENYLLPSRWQSYQLQGASGITLDTGWGILLLQVVRVNGFQISYQLLEVRQAGELIFSCHSDTAVLYFLLQGDLDHRTLSGAPIAYQREQQFGLGFHYQKKIFRFHYTTGEYHLFQITFSPHMLSLLVGSVASRFLSTTQGPADSRFSPFFPMHQRVQKLLKRVRWHAQRLERDIIPLNTLLLQLLDRFATAFLQQQKDERWRTKKEWQISSLEAYIEEHLDIDEQKVLTVAYLARKTRINPYQFNKLFKEYYGESLRRLVRKKQMEKALALLKEERLTPGAIYLRVGYSDFSSFSRAFSRYYGFAPSQVGAG